MKYISISGTVAAGKTTLLNLLLQQLQDRASFHREQPEKNPFICQYYADSTRWSFHSQMTFLSLYFEQMDWLNEDHEFFFFDRCLIENLVIAQYRHQEGHLSDEEYHVIEQMANGISRLMPPIDKYIYLRCSTQLLVARLRERGREYEGQLGWDYAQKLNSLYEEWLNTLPRERVLILDEDRGIDLEEVLRFIEADEPKPTHVPEDC